MAEMDETSQSINSVRGAYQIADLYRRGRHLFSTRTAEAFEAEDVSDGSSLLLWLLRFPFAAGSDEVGRFLRRLHDIESVRTPPPSVLRFGVDARGSAFVAMELLNGTSVFDGSSDPEIQVQLFRRVIEHVVPLHRAGICLGDIAEDSFLLYGDRRVALIGIVGAFDTGARKTGSLPQADTLHYLAPEQRGGGSADFSSDVFALGVFGYRLFAGRYLQQEKFAREGAEVAAGTAPAPSMVREELPPWLDDVVGAALQPRPGRRYADAGSLLQAVQSEGQINTVPNGRAYWSRSTVSFSADEVAPARAPKRERVPTTHVGRRPAGGHFPRPSRNVLAWTGAVLLGVAAAGGVFYSLMRSDASNSAVAAAVHLEYAPEELRELIEAVTDPDTTAAERTTSLAEIAESSNPIAYAVLVSLAAEDVPVSTKREVQRLLIDRIRNNRLYRSADVLERWFETALRTGIDPGATSAYALLLRACDSSRFAKSRREALLEAAKTEPLVSLQLSAALALEDSPEQFTPVVRILLEEQGAVEDAQKMGLSSLLFAHKALGIFIDEDLVRSIGRFSDEDLYRAALQLAERDEKLLNEVLREALLKRRFPPYRAVFLEPVLEPGRQPPRELLRRSLIRASFGKTNDEDLFRFARWQSPDAERVLLAVAATAADDGIALDAFDVLAGRSLRKEPARTLFDWAKRRLWNQRSRVMKALAVLSLPEVAGRKEFEYAFGALAPYANAGLFKAVAASDDPALIEEAVRRMGPSAKSEQLISLLSHRDTRVRIEAIRTLKGRNDLAVLQSILQGFEKERDEEVREVYRELHWVTRER